MKRLRGKKYKTKPNKAHMNNNYCRANETIVFAKNSLLFCARRKHMFRFLFRAISI